MSWLLMIAAVLVATLIFAEGHAQSLAATPEFAAAAAVIACLVALYAMVAPKSGSGRLRVLWIACAALSALTLAGLWTGRWDAGWLLASNPTRDTIAATSAAATVRLRKGPAGTFIARGELNGVATDFVVDTGSAALVLKHSDAVKAGIDIDASAFSVAVQTANGTMYAAPVSVRSVRIGPIAVASVEALVAPQGSLNESLLGISFLTRLRSYETTPEFMTLRQ